MAVVEMTVEEDGGTAVAELWWKAVPHLRFDLRVAADGRVEELKVTAPPGRSVGSRNLREVPVGLMVRTVRKRIADHAKSVRSSADHLKGLPKRLGRPDLEVAALRAQQGADYADELASRWEKAANSRDRRGNTYYASVAAAYVELLADRAPVAALAKNLGVSASKVRNDLFAARERGLLTSTGQGRAGGELTDEAREILAAAEGN